MSMKASINRDGCISCGVCEATCPKVFRMAEVYVDTNKPCIGGGAYVS